MYIIVYVMFLWKTCKTTFYVTFLMHHVKYLSIRRAPESVYFLKNQLPCESKIALPTI